jgi:hypothetical protein
MGHRRCLAVTAPAFTRISFCKFEDVQGDDRRLKALKRVPVAFYFTSQSELAYCKGNDAARAMIQVVSDPIAG